jgi:hypothetical protein
MKTKKFEGLVAFDFSNINLQENGRNNVFVDFCQACDMECNNSDGSECDHCQ